MIRIKGNGKAERRGDGKYRLRVFLGYTPDGKKKEKSKIIYVDGDTPFAQECNANAELRRFMASIEKGLQTDGKLPYKEFVELWKEKYSDTRHEISTAQWYQRMQKRTILYFGNKRLEDIHVKDVESFLNWLIKKEGQTNKNANRHLKILKTILNQAVKWEYIYRNPCLSVSFLNTKPVEHSIYNEDMVRTLIEIVSGCEIKYQLYVLLPLFCGLRREEVIALKISEIDIEKRELHVNSAVIYAGKEYGVIRKGTKTASSKRKVEIPQFLIPILKEYIDNEIEIRKVAALEGDYKDYLFVNYETGKGLYPTTPTHWFMKFLQRYNLPKITYHELRHTYTSLLYSDNIDLAKISRSLGHSSVATTTQIYVHAVRNAEQVLASSLDNRFGSKFREKETNKD